MIRTEKAVLIEELVDKFNTYDAFYVTDSSSMTVEQMNKLRRVCFEQGVEFRVVKNALIRKAFEQLDPAGQHEAVMPALKGTTALMFAESAKTPATLLKAFRAQNDKPLLKAAYIGAAVYFGDDQIDALTKIKSKHEMLGEILGLLQSPMQNVLGALQSGGHTLAGLIKTLEEREA